MSISKLYNVTANTLRPGPVLVIGKDAAGLTTGSMDFSCRKGDLSSSFVLAKLAKGTPIIDLYPLIGTKFTFLYVDSWTSRDAPGGYSIVSVDFKGVDISGEDTFDSSIVYTRTNSMVEVPIFGSPKFISAVSSASQRDLIRRGSTGELVLVGSSTLRNSVTGIDVGSLDNADEEFWWDWIVVKQNLTYERPSSEWTRTATGRGALPSSAFVNFGWISTPPGSPGAPTGFTWRYMGSTESYTAVGDGANSYSQTWLMGIWPTEVYTAPA